LSWSQAPLTAPCPGRVCGCWTELNCCIFASIPFIRSGSALAGPSLTCAAGSGFQKTALIDSIVGSNQAKVSDVVVLDSGEYHA
jgi:hypothetical protein